MENITSNQTISEKNNQLLLKMLAEIQKQNQKLNNFSYLEERQRAERAFMELIYDNEGPYCNTSKFVFSECEEYNLDRNSIYSKMLFLIEKLYEGKTSEQ